jgi:glucan 1,3-beta-glucosidase
VNMDGVHPGDVGIWNTHITVGGTADSKVNTVCGGSDTSDCKAAFALAHLTASSGAYIENMWGWVADHSLDGGDHQNIAVGRGMLVEATKGTWLTGTGFEHVTLYNYNFHNAQNVYAGMQQTETAYWQGEGSLQNAPAPWTALSNFGDPDFSWCGGGDQKCRMGLATNIDGGSNIFLYAAAFWTFFHGETQTRYNFPGTICGSDCIANQVRVTGNPKGLYWYGVNTRCATTIILDGKNNPKERNNPGGWGPGGVVAGYLQFSGA